MTSAVQAKTLMLLMVLSVCPTAVDAGCDGVGAAGEQLVVSGSCTSNHLNGPYKVLLQMEKKSL